MLNSLILSCFRAIPVCDDSEWKSIQPRRKEFKKSLHSSSSNTPKRSIRTHSGSDLEHGKLGASHPTKPKRKGALHGVADAGSPFESLLPQNTAESSLLEPNFDNFIDSSPLKAAILLPSTPLDALNPNFVDSHSFASSDACQSNAENVSESTTTHHSSFPTPASQSTPSNSSTTTFKLLEDILCRFLIIS